MSLLKKATEQSQSDWLPVPEGLWRWRVGTAELKMSEKFGKYQVRFPLTLTNDERKRLEDDIGTLADGTQQSYRVSYTCGLSLGYVQRDGQYKSTRLVDFLAACFGTESQKKFRAWIAAGGGPESAENEDEELAHIRSWLGWIEDMEVYGSISHAADAVQTGVVWARFAGVLPVGAIPGNKDPEYQAFGRGKLRALMAESGVVEVPEKEPKGAPVAAGAGAKPARSYDDIFGDQDAL